MGGIPYYSGLPTIDMLGLTDEHIAHKGKTASWGSIAHRRLDANYLLSRKPDIVLVEFGVNTLMEKYYDPTKDITTNMISQFLETQWQAWPALIDLVNQKEFRRKYVPRSVELKPNKY